MNPFPSTPAGRFAYLMELYAPTVVDDEGRFVRHDPSLGVISKEQLLELLEAPCPTSPEKP